MRDGVLRPTDPTAPEPAARTTSPPPDLETARWPAIGSTGPLEPVTETTAPELASEAADSRLVRHVRRNLVLWSGGTTLVILLVLAVALYLAVASSLASTATAQLDSRFDQVRSSLTGQRPDPDDSGPYGFLFGGGGSGTIALAVDAGNQVLAPRGFHVPPGLPDMAGVAAARANGRDVRNASLTGQSFGPGGSTTQVSTPVRILTENVALTAGPTYTVQIIADRIAEDRTLAVMLVVLAVGGLVVVLVAFGFGFVYARRALVPIRESLTNQRVALRRQREFAADASHELRTPLTVIRSSVDYLVRHRDEPVAAVGSALEDIDDEVGHMTVDRRGPAAAGPLRFRGRGARARPGRSGRRRRRRGIGDGQARD